MRAGVIDIGSNSVLLTIAEKSTPTKPVISLVDHAEVTGLAKGLSQTKNISSEALQKTISVLKNYRQILDQFAVESFRGVSTEALRKAENGAKVKEQLEEALGYPLELISGDREAELSFWSVQEEFIQRESLKTVFDIGGASTELCLGDHEGIKEKVSLKVGSVLLTENFSLDHPRTDPAKAIQYVETLLAEVPWISRAKASLGIGVAGTITSLFAMDAQVEPYERMSVHGKKLSSEKVKQWMDRFLELNPDERRKIPGLHPTRADIFGGGITLIYALLNFLEWNELYCMDSGVRYGLLYEIFKPASPFK